MAAAGNRSPPQTRTFRRVYTKISHESVRQVDSPNRGNANMATDGSHVNQSRSNSRTGYVPQTERSEKLFQRSDSVSHITNRLVEMLDHIEKRVELLREHACAMEQERDSLLTMLNTIHTNKDLCLVSEGEREEIEITAQRLMGRTLTVEVTVTTPRDDVQQKALDQVNRYIDELLSKIKSDLDGAKRNCHEYLNACLPEAKGPISLKFQAAIIECTADDQKKIKKRLESLLATIVHAEGNLQD